MFLSFPIATLLSLAGTEGIHTFRDITIRDEVVNKYLSTAEYSLVWNKNLVMYSVISEGGGGGGEGGSAATTMTTFLLLASLLVK